MTARRAALRMLMLVVVVVAATMLPACRRAEPVDCEQVPTTADGCRERCHDRGAEMAFFRFDPGTYRCDATCECTAGPPSSSVPR